VQHLKKKADIGTVPENFIIIWHMKKIKEYKPVWKSLGQEQERGTRVGQRWRSQQLQLRSVYQPKQTLVNCDTTGN
jgi:hypothetical protein